MSDVVRCCVTVDLPKGHPAGALRDPSLLCPRPLHWRRPPTNLSMRAMSRRTVRSPRSVDRYSVVSGFFAQKHISEKVLICSAHILAYIHLEKKQLHFFFYFIYRGYHCVLTSDSEVGRDPATKQSITPHKLLTSSFFKSALITPLTHTLLSLFLIYRFFTKPNPIRFV